MFYGKHRAGESQRRNVYLPVLECNSEPRARTITEQGCNNTLWLRKHQTFQYKI